MRESNRNALSLFQTAQSFMVWVHFRPPLKYTASSGNRHESSTNKKISGSRKRPILSNSWFTGELGLADEYSARVEIEVDSPGPSHVIQSIPLRARSGTARVHAPKDLQVLKTCSKALGFEASVTRHILALIMNRHQASLSYFLGLCTAGSQMLFVLLSRQSACRLRWVNPVNRCCH